MSITETKQELKLCKQVDLVMNAMRERGQRERQREGEGERQREREREIENREENMYFIRLSDCEGLF